MIKDTSTVIVESEVMPGVVFTIRRMSFGLRSRIRKMLAPVLALIREKTDEIERLSEEHQLNGAPAEQAAAEDTGIVALPEEGTEAPAAPAPAKTTARFTPAQLRVIEKISDISNEIEIIGRTETDPVYLRECLISISGYEIDGKVPDWQLLLDQGNEKLCQEIVDAIKAESGLTAKVSANLKSPTTSGAAAGGPTNDTTAPNADKLDTGSNETAVSTSQST